MVIKRLVLTILVVLCSVASGTAVNANLVNGGLPLVTTGNFELDGTFDSDATRYCLRCYNDDCDFDEHQAMFDWEAGFNFSDSQGGSHSTCWSGFCSEKHPSNETCSIGGEDPLQSVSAVEAAILSASATDLRRLVSDRPSVSFNPERQSIQVASCTGLIVANLQLTAELAGRFTRPELE